MSIISPAPWPFPVPSNATPEVTSEHEGGCECCSDEYEDEDSLPANAREVYLIETVCGGKDASGGGCGGPLGVQSVSKEWFERSSGSNTGMIMEHNSWEHDFGKCRILGVKMEYRPGSCCRGMS